MVTKADLRTTPPRNLRAGRPRKSGARFPSGKLIPAEPEDSAQTVGLAIRLREVCRVIGRYADAKELARDYRLNPEHMPTLLGWLGRVSPRQQLAACSSTTPPSTPAGSTWSRSRSACCVANASTVASTIQPSSNAKSPLGNGNETPPARVKWMFTIDKARSKMGRAYPCQAKES
jgi:hypothetical protein